MKFPRNLEYHQYLIPHQQCGGFHSRKQEHMSGYLRLSIFVATGQGDGVALATGEHTLADYYPELASQWLGER